MSRAASLPVSGPQRGITSATLHAAFVVTGAVTTLLGPILPLLIARWSLSDAQAGLFFTLQFCGNLAGLAVLGMLLARRGYCFTLALGFALMAAGVAGLLAAGEFVAWICTSIFGCGLGLNISGINLWVGEDAGAEPPARRAGKLSLLNMLWGLGAVAFPPLVRLAEERHRLPELLLSLSALCGIAALFLVLRGEEPRALLHSEDAGGGETPSRWQSLVSLGCLFFIYVGTEASLSGWTAALAQRLAAPGMTRAEWPLAPMFFWVGLLAGRGLAPVVLRALSGRALLMAGLTLAAASTGALLRTDSFAGTAVCVAAAGLGLASTYPLLVAWMLALLGAGARRRANLLFALGCAGGATLPWLVGFASSHAGSLRAGLLVPLAGCVAMLALLSLLRRPSGI